MDSATLSAKGSIRRKDGDLGSDHAPLQVLANEGMRRPGERQAQLTSDLDAAEIAAIERAEMPPGFEHLNAELNRAD